MNKIEELRTQRGLPLAPDEDEGSLPAIGEIEEEGEDD